MVLKKNLIMNHCKTKTNSYEGKFNINSHDDGMLKEGSHCICFSVILIDSVFKISKNYCPKVFSKKNSQKR